MLEESLRDMIELARARLAVTEEPGKQEKLVTGIMAGEELLEFLKAQRAVVSRQAEFILATFYDGGLFGGDNGRTGDSIGPWPED